MRIIELKKRYLDLPKLTNQGAESTIYINNDKLYKIFNEDIKINLKIRKDITEFIYSKKDKLKGLIQPEEELYLNNEFVGFTMKKYDLKTIDNYFDSNIPYEQRYNYALQFIDIFNRMNNLDIEHTDFHNDNIFIDKDNNPLIGDITSIRIRRNRRRSKIEQLSLLISLLFGYNLTNNRNYIVLEDVISSLGTNKMLDYFYNPKENLDKNIFDGFMPNTLELERINKTYGGL